MATSLKDFALRVSLTVRKPQLTAKDDKATNDAEIANNAHNAGQYRKELYPKALLAGIQEAESAARAFIARNTIDSVLPSPRFMQFADDLAKYEISYNQAVTVFMQNYSNVLTAAQSSQGSMFDASLYPDMASLRARFSWEVNYEPVADHSQFAHIIGQMEAPAAAHLTTAVTRQVQAQQDAVTEAAIKRLKDVVAHMAVATARPDRVVTAKNGALEARPPIFRASMVDNITELADLIEGYAAALPTNVASLVTQARTLTTHNAEALRNDADKRKELSKAATALLADIDAQFTGSLSMPQTITQPAQATPMAVDVPAEEQVAVLQTMDAMDKAMEPDVAALAAVGILADDPIASLEAKIAHATGLPVAPQHTAAKPRPAPKEYDMGGLFAALDDMED